MKVLLFVALWSVSLASFGYNTGMKVSASVDIQGSSKVSGESDAENRIDVREAEILIYGPVDHVFDGLLSLAAHKEEGASLFEVHEAFLSSSKLVPRSTIKVGTFFLGVGRLNRIHRHEWPFISAPKVHALFFGKEGVLDSGFEYSYVAPLPFYLDLTLGVTNGWVYGHSHNGGQKPKSPTHYMRAGTYSALFGGGVQTGLNVLSRTAADGEKMVLTGIDFVAKWRDGETLTTLLQSEAWLRTRNVSKGDEERVFGAYLLPQYAISSSVFLGTRFDYYSILSLKDVAVQPIGNREIAVVPTITYKVSEFSMLRMAYSYVSSKQDGKEEQKSQKIEVQATFMMGAHPAHDF